jgi:predicted nucleic acid-binding protein
MCYLLDTSAILAHYRKELGWETVQALFETPEVELIVASVTLTELGRRLRDLGATEDDAVAAIANYLLLFSEVVVVDATVANAAFVLGCRAAQRVPLVDTLIAAAAQGEGAVLVHRDAHLRHIPSALVAQLDLEVSVNNAPGAD